MQGTAYQKRIIAYFVDGRPRTTDVAPEEKPIYDPEGKEIGKELIDRAQAFFDALPPEANAIWITGADEEELEANTRAWQDAHRSITDIISAYDAKAEKRLSDWAVLHKYASSERLLSYVDSTIPLWKFEADNFRALWDNTWLWLQNYLNAKLVEEPLVIPAWEELEDLLDIHVPLTWPEFSGD